MSTIGQRLKQERLRLGMSQPEFAAIAGAKKRTLIDWEKDVSSPTARQLGALEQIGVDVIYVVTGPFGRTVEEMKKAQQELGISPKKGDVMDLTKREKKLLALYRAATNAGKGAIETIAKAVEKNQ